MSGWSRAFRVAVTLILIVGISVTGYLVLAEQRPPADPDYRIVLVSRDTVISRVSVTGSVEPNKRANLSFKAAGRVAEVLVESGQQVEESQLLARLEARELELSLEQSRTGLEIAKYQLRQLEAGPSAGELAAARANVESAIAAYERTASGPSAEEIASARASLESAQAGLQLLRQGPSEQEITVAKANLEQTRIALEQAQAAYDRVAWVGGVGALPQSLQLQQATISYEAALASYELATKGPTESQLKAAEAQVAQARSALDRLLSSPSPSDLALAEAQVVQAQANHDRLENTPAEEQVRVAEQQVRQAELAVQQSELALEGTRLIAPFRGVVGRVHLITNETAPMGQPAVVLVDLSEFYVDVSVDEIDITHVQLGQDVVLVLDALPDAMISGSVEKIDPVPQSVGGVVSYTVRIQMGDADPRLRAGMTTTVDIITARNERVLTVPGRAIRVDRETGRTYVEKLVNQRPVPVEIELGLRGDQVSEVITGLSEGDQVIIRDVSSMERLLRTFGG